MNRLIAIPSWPYTGSTAPVSTSRIPPAKAIARLTVTGHPGSQPFTSDVPGSHPYSHSSQSRPVTIIHDMKRSSVAWPRLCSSGGGV